MFAGGFFPKSYFAGTYWAPATGSSIIDDDGYFPYPILRRRARR